MIENKVVDILFTDIVMPGPIDGFKLIDQVRARWPRVKVLLTSGFPAAKLNGKVEPLPSDVRFLTKPYRRSELATVVREVLDS